MNGEQIVRWIIAWREGDEDMAVNGFDEQNIARCGHELDAALRFEGEVLCISPRTVRDHLDGDEHYEAALEWATDVQIEDLLGDEPMYEQWAAFCRSIGDELVKMHAKQHGGEL